MPADMNRITERICKYCGKPYVAHSTDNNPDPRHPDNDKVCQGLRGKFISEE